MREPKWLLQSVVLAVHRKTLNEQGGLSGIRDMGLLESALARPVNAFQYTPESTMFELAASYGYGIASNHPFNDGNKRVAFYASAGFLQINGLVLTAEEPDAAMVFIDLAAGKLSEEQLADWFSQHTVRVVA